MRIEAKLVWLLPVTALLAHAAEEQGESQSLVMWNWANFVLLVIGLGYLMAKMLPPLFAERSKAIVRDMTESEKIRKEAQERAADVERRLAGLETEITALRVESKRESEAETQRIAQHTEAEIAKIEAHSRREIDAAGKAARLELKRYAAELAVRLAEQKIRSRMTPATEDGLVRGFVRDLK